MITLFLGHPVDIMCAGQCGEHLGVVVPSEEQLYMPGQDRGSTCKYYLVLTYNDIDLALVDLWQ